jgi:aspartokinase/homoserine dehydrogenase 1
MKFGGSCLENSESFLQTKEIIKKYYENSNLIVVCSAIKGITDLLIEYYEEICNQGTKCEDLLQEIKNTHNSLIEILFKSEQSEYEKSKSFLDENYSELIQLGQIIRLIRPSPDVKDLVLSYGEKLSTYIISQYLSSEGIYSLFIPSDQLIVTNDNFGKSFPLLRETEHKIKQKILPFLKNKKICICVTGFFGATIDQKIATFGRGGSDLTAAVIAYSLRNNLKCKVIYWKDVNGFLDADPTFVDHPSLIRIISYIEAKELSFFGSKILHPLCLDVS